MRVGASHLAVVQDVPDDIKVVPITAFAAAVGPTERHEQEILNQHGVPLGAFGPSSKGATSLGRGRVEGIEGWGSAKRPSPRVGGRPGAAGRERPTRSPKRTVRSWIR